MILVRASRIKRYTDYSVLYFLREIHCVSKFIDEIRNSNKDRKYIPIFTLKSFDYSKSIYGEDFWNDIYERYNWWNRHLFNKYKSNKRRTKRLNNVKDNKMDL